MTDKELKRLSRAELLEMLLIQTREVEKLKQELEKAQSEVEQRRIHLESAGSIAQASLELNGVFEAAQAAADQFLENIAAMEQETKQRCQEMLEQTQLECQTMRDEAQKEAKGFWNTIRDEIRDPYRDHMWWTKIMGEINSHIVDTPAGGAHEE